MGQPINWLLHRHVTSPRGCYHCAGQTIFCSITGPRRMLVAPTFGAYVSWTYQMNVLLVVFTFSTLGYHVPARHQIPSMIVSSALHSQAFVTQGSAVQSHGKVAAFLRWLSSFRCVGRGSAQWLAALAVGAKISDT